MRRDSRIIPMRSHGVSIYPGAAAVESCDPACAQRSGMGRREIGVLP